jgi:hypothetical protein
MNILRPFSSIPELRELDDEERMKVVRQWEREAIKPWSGYLLSVGFSLLVVFAIVFLASLLFPGLSTMPGGWIGGMVLGLWVAQILYNAFILPKRRDLLQRILEQRGRTPVCAIRPGATPIHLWRAWMAVISYCVLFVVVPIALVYIASRFGNGALLAASLVLLFVFVALGESGFRIWRRIWRIP